ncbi:hypothetical protein GGI42DRAFT_156295 [Trichoderma sp. SZMC 28013]
MDAYTVKLFTILTITILIVNAKSMSNLTDHRASEYTLTVATTLAQGIRSSSLRQSLRQETEGQCSYEDHKDKGW